MKKLLSSILLFAGLSITFVNAQNYVLKNTWGGEGIKTEGFVQSPRTFTLDANGNVYVHDVVKSLIVKFNSTGDFISSWPLTIPIITIIDMEINNEGNLFILDMHLNKVSKFNTNGDLIMSWGSQGALQGQFDSPMSLSSDSHGNIFVSDLNNSRIQVFSSQGDFLREILGGGQNEQYTPGSFYRPQAITIDENDNLYIYDYTKNDIQKFDNLDVFKTQISGGIPFTPGYKFYGIRDIAVNNNGELFIAQISNAAKKFNSSGDLIAEWNVSGVLNDTQSDVSGIEIDNQSQTVFIGDYYANKIQKFTSTGTRLGFIGKEFPDGTFSTMQSIVTDSEGSVYVADDYHIQKFSSEGVFQRKWGVSSPANNLGYPFQFSILNKIAIDKFDNVYTLDWGFPNIQKFTKNGEFVSSWEYTPGTGFGEVSGLSSLAIDLNGNIYIGDEYLHCIHKFSNSGQYLGKFDGNQILGINDFYPLEIHFDSNNNLIVFNYASTNTIVKLDNNGALLANINLIDLNIIGAYQIDIDRYDNIYVSNPFISNSSIKKINSSGSLISSFELPSNLSFYPFDFAVDKTNGDMFTLERSEYVVSKYSYCAASLQLTITGPNTVCNSKSFNTTSTSGSTYLWTISNGAPIVSGQGTSTVQLDFSGITNAGDLSVIETTANGCTVTSAPFTVTPTSGPDISNITGTNVFCGNGTNDVLTALPNLAGVTYTWTATDQSAFIGQLNNLGSFRFSPEVASYTITAKATNAQGCSGASFSKVVTRKLSLGAIAGPTTLCAFSSGNAFSVPLDDPSASYFWNTSSGFVTSGNGLNQITLTVNAASGDATIFVQERDLSGCYSNSAKVVVPIKVSAMAIGITGPANVCPNQTNVTYTTSNILGATYAWTVPVGATIISGSTTNSIVVNYSNFTSVGTISVTSQQPNACKPISASLAVNGSLAGTTVMYGPSKVCANAQLNSYSVQYNNGSTYSWTVPANATVLYTGQQGRNILVSFNNFTTGTFSVTETLAGGCIAAPISMVVSSVGVSSTYEIPAVNVSCNSSTFEIKVNTLTPISSGVNSFQIGFTFDPRVIRPVTTGTFYTPGPVINSVGAASLSQRYSTIGIDPTTSVYTYSVNTTNGATFNGKGNVVSLKFNVASGAAVGAYTPINVVSLIEGLVVGGQTTICPANVGLVSVVGQETVLNGQLLLNSTTTPLGYNSANPTQYLPTTISGSPSSLCGATSTTTLPDLNGKFTYDISNGNYLSFTRDIVNTTNTMGYLDANDALRIGQLGAASGAFPTVYDMLSADIDKSGYVTGNDAYFMLQRLTFGSYDLPALGTMPDWIFLDNTTLGTAPYKRSVNYPLTDASGGFSLDKPLPSYSTCLPVKQVSNGTCTDIPDEIYRGILVGDVATPKFTNLAGTNIKTAGNAGYTAFSGNGSLVIDLAKAKSTLQGTWIVPVIQYAGDTAQAFDINMNHNEKFVTILNVTKEEQSMLYSWNLLNSEQLLVSGFSLSPIKDGTVLYEIEVTKNSIMEPAAWGETFFAKVNGAIVEGVVRKSSDIELMSSIHVYPNPTTDKLFLSESPSEFNVEIRSMTGEMVYSAKNETELSVASLAAGMYVLIVKTETDEKRFKFTKVK